MCVLDRIVDHKSRRATQVMADDDRRYECESQVGFREELWIGNVQFHELVDQVPPFPLPLRRDVGSVNRRVQLQHAIAIAVHLQRTQLESGKNPHHMYQDRRLLEYNKIVKHSGENGCRIDTHTQQSDLLLDKSLAGHLATQGLPDSLPRMNPARA